MLRSLQRFIDFRMATRGAAIMATIVWLVNCADGPLLAFVAAAKQGAYTFLAAGLVMRLCESLARRLEPWQLAVPLAVLVPAVLSTTATFAVHSLRGTAQPLLSTIPTVLLAPPGFLWWAITCRRAPAGAEPSLALAPGPATAPRGGRG